MKEKFEIAIRKSHPSWAYGLEIVAGTLLTVCADNFFNFNGALEQVYNYTTSLSGILLIGDGLRRINNISNYYKNTMMETVKKNLEKKVNKENFANIKISPKSEAIKISPSYIDN